ncbi:MAG: glycosyltransferase family 4 protein [bacterium]|nr:glycosyltransferase family 4 protein [bacterium]
MAKKKILYVITKSNWGGAQRYVHDLATSLSKEQFNVAVLFGGYGNLKEKLNSQGVRTIALPNFDRDTRLRNDTKTFFALIRIFKKERPDIIHLNSSKAGILGALAGRIARVQRIIFTAHGWAFNEERPWWQKKIITFLHIVTIVLSHKTIAVSNKTKNQITHLTFIKQKIVVVHNGIDTLSFVSREDSRTFLSSKNKSLNNKKEMAWIGTIAELHTTKGLFYAIEAMQNVAHRFPNIIYIIMGDGEKRQQLEEMIQTYTLSNRVFLLGHIDNAAEYLPAFDIFLLPSLSEALPYTLLEAGLAKLPVVGSAVGGIPEIIEDKKSGVLIPPRDSQAITDAMSELLEKPYLQKQYGDKLFEVVKEKFSLREMLQKTVGLYLPR